VSARRCKADRWEGMQGAVQRYIKQDIGTKGYCGLPRTHMRNCAVKKGAEKRSQQQGFPTTTGPSHALSGQRKAAHFNLAK
jgi:hypothetical protein